MEFPDVGKQCEVGSCRQLDYLCFQCSGCHKIVCHQHFPPANHDCVSPPIKDEMVVCCPICGSPIPGRKDQDPNVRVNDHINSGCKPAPKSTSKAFSKDCALEGCKKKSAVFVTCPTCQKEFCLSHRLEADHQCTGPPAAATTSSVWGNFFPSTQPRSSPSPATNSRTPSPSQAAKARPSGTQPAPKPTTVSRDRPNAARNDPSSVQVSGLTEEEQIAIAIQNSLEDASRPGQPSPPPAQEQSSCAIS